GCLTPELEEKVSAHLERGTELLNKEEREGGAGWILVGLTLFGLGLGVRLLSRVNKARSFEVECSSCGGAVSWPAGLRKGYCPYCKSLLEYG
ncbi:hypothetical protein LR013_06250, partial [candidate division NPL-UPA2 bacterium]|nr:hypothetical protein [candidate division NPL-UPA2 bacterium]